VNFETDKALEHSISSLRRDQLLALLKLGLEAAEDGDDAMPGCSWGDQDWRLALSPSDPMAFRGGMRNDELRKV
jgi:hypothetical protein